MDNHHCEQPLIEQIKVKILETEGIIHDLSYNLDQHTLQWPGGEQFNICMNTCFQVDSNTKEQYFYSAAQFSCAEHSGTHVDSPYHFSEFGITVDQIPLQTLIGPCRLIDISIQCQKDSSYALSQEDINHYESKYSKIEEGDIVLIRTGWSKYYLQGALQYMGYDEKTMGKYNHQPLNFPGIGKEAAQLFVERKIAAVGLDTASLDPGSCVDFYAHRILLGAGIYGIENLNSNIDNLPTNKSFTLVVMPLKLKGGSGSPSRIFAITKP